MKRATKGGREASWYKRQHHDLEPWERCNTINGTTNRKFRSLIKDTSWSIYYKHHPTLTTSMNRKHPLLSLIRYTTAPFAQLRGLEEFLSDRIVYILEKGRSN